MYIYYSIDFSLAPPPPTFSKLCLYGIYLIFFKFSVKSNLLQMGCWAQFSWCNYAPALFMSETFSPIKSFYVVVK